MNTPQSLTRLRRLDLMKTRVRKISNVMADETRNQNFHVRRHMEIMRAQVDEQNGILAELVAAMREKQGGV